MEDWVRRQLAEAPERTDAWDEEVAAIYMAGAAEIGESAAA